MSLADNIGKYTNINPKFDELNLGKCCLIEYNSIYGRYKDIYNYVYKKSINSIGYLYYRIKQ